MGQEITTSIPSVRSPLASPPPIPTVDDVYDSFLGGRSPATARAYAADIVALSAYLGTLDGPSGITALFAAGQGGANRILLGWKDAMMRDGLSSATIARRLAATRSVVRMGRMLGVIAWTVDVRSPKVKTYRDTRGPDRDAWRAILTSAKARPGPIGLRDVAMIRLMRDMGLRRAEVLGIDVAHVDLVGSAILVTGKGRREADRITMPGPVRDAMAAWLDVRGSSAGAVFIRMDRGAKAGKPERLDGRGAHKIIGTIGERAGHERPLRPHMLRHSGITAALDATAGNYRAVAKFSRHAKIETLQLYDDNRTDEAGRVAGLISEE